MCPAMCVVINAPDDIGTLLVDSLLVEHGIPPRDVRFDSNVAFPAVAASLQGGKISAAFAPEPFVSLDEQKFGIRAVSAMLRFGLLPPSDDAFRITSMTGA